MLTFILVTFVYYVVRTIVRHDMVPMTVVTDIHGLSVYFLASEMKPYDISFDLLTLLEQEYGIRNI